MSITEVFKTRKKDREAAYREALLKSSKGGKRDEIAIADLAEAAKLSGADVDADELALKEHATLKANIARMAASEQDWKAAFDIRAELEAVRAAFEKAAAALHERSAQASSSLSALAELRQRLQQIEDKHPRVFPPKGAKQ